MGPPFAASVVVGANSRPDNYFVTVLWQHLLDSLPRQILRHRNKTGFKCSAWSFRLLSEMTVLSFQKKKGGK